MNYLTIYFPIFKSRSLSFLKLIYILTFFALILISSLTIFQMSLYAQEFLLIKNNERKIANLREENKNLEIEFSQKNSLSNLKDYLKDFEKAKDVKYIKITGSSIVEK